jgi:chromosome segregation ATPase
MTIKEYAAQHKISPQAVYQRVKKNKIKVETLTEKGTGELTAEGIIILDKLFDPENRQIKPAKDELIEALEKQISELRAEVASKTERVKSLEEQTASLKEDKEYFKQALEKEQQNIKEIKALLPSPTPAAEKTSDAGRRLSMRERLSGRLGSSSKG